jgi:hypothetical protein
MEKPKLFLLYGVFCVLLIMVLQSVFSLYQVQQKDARDCQELFDKFCEDLVKDPSEKCVYYKKCSNKDIQLL